MSKGRGGHDWFSVWLATYMCAHRRRGRTYLVGGRVEGRGVVPEERLCAVTVMNVDVNHGHALDTVFRLC